LANKLLAQRNIETPPCNENQLDALFILSLFRQSTSTGFGHICSPSSGGILYIYNNSYVLCWKEGCLKLLKRIYVCNENQLDALFILSLFRPNQPVHV